MAKRSDVARQISRSIDLHNGVGVDPVVKVSFESLLQDDANRSVTAGVALEAAKVAARGAKLAARTAIESVDKSYRTARALAQGHLPSVEVPGTLGEQPTDTERKDALAFVLRVVTEHRGEPWADLLLDGEFGTLAPEAIAKLATSLDADMAAGRALAARNAADEKAYQSFLSFKQVVRHHCGKTSKEYRWIHLRAPKTSPVSQPQESSQPHADAGPVAGASSGNGSSTTVMYSAPEKAA